MRSSASLYNEGDTCTLSYTLSGLHAMYIIYPVCARYVYSKLYTAIGAHAWAVLINSRHHTCSSIGNLPSQYLQT